MSVTGIIVHTAKDHTSEMTYIVLVGMIASDISR